MAYADQQGMSTSRIVSIVLVGLLHAFIAYALITGLAYEAVRKVKEKMEVVDVTEEKPPEEEPPPPPPDKVIVTPPPVVAIRTPAPTNNTATVTKTDTKPVITNTQPTTKPCNGGNIPIDAVCTPIDPEVTCPDGVTRVKASQRGSCPAPKKSQKAGAVAKGNPGSWANTNDYPSRDLSQEHEGTSGFRVTIGPDGRVTDCQITSSSGFPGLDAATCANVKRRARFTPAKDDDGNPTTGSYSNRVRWQIPKE
jgi:periplasmic protein TonB